MSLLARGYLVLTVSASRRETGLLLRTDWNVRVIATGRLFLSLYAFFRAFRADGVGFRAKVTVPADVTLALPLAKTILDGRHLPPSLTKPCLHLADVRPKTPNFPFWNVSSQLNVPGSATDSVNVIMWLVGLNTAPSVLKVLLGGVTWTMIGVGPGITVTVTVVVVGGVLKV
jgi:hypothetical protein